MGGEASSPAAKPARLPLKKSAARRPTHVNTGNPTAQLAIRVSRYAGRFLLQTPLMGLPRRLPTDQPFTEAIVRGGRGLSRSGPSAALSRLPRWGQPPSPAYPIDRTDPPRAGLVQRSAGQSRKSSSPRWPRQRESSMKAARQALRSSASKKPRTVEDRTTTRRSSAARMKRHSRPRRVRNTSAHHLLRSRQGRTCNPRRVLVAAPLPRSPWWTARLAQSQLRANLSQSKGQGQPQGRAQHQGQGQASRPERSQSQGRAAVRRRPNRATGAAGRVPQRLRGGRRKKKRPQGRRRLGHGGGHVRGWWEAGAAGRTRRPGDRQTGLYQDPALPSDGNSNAEAAELERIRRGQPRRLQGRGVDLPLPADGGSTRCTRQDKEGWPDFHPEPPSRTTDLQDHQGRAAQAEAE